MVGAGSSRGIAIPICTAVGLKCVAKGGALGQLQRRIKGNLCRCIRIILGSGAGQSPQGKGSHGAAVLVLVPNRVLTKAGAHRELGSGQRLAVNKGTGAQLQTAGHIVKLNIRQPGASGKGIAANTRDPGRNSYRLQGCDMEKGVTANGSQALRQLHIRNSRQLAKQIVPQPGNALLHLYRADLAAVGGKWRQTLRGVIRRSTGAGEGQGAGTLLKHIIHLTIT